MHILCAAGLSPSIPAEFPGYDESGFIEYAVERLKDDSGFSFRLLDDSIPEIVFPVAWVKNKQEGLWEYEDAVELWTT